jgi:Rps23 Pro-64 3,4-dihydroxylase Tpa1-like proline 4-hydroxylase
MPSAIRTSMSPPSIASTNVLHPHVQSDNEALAREFQGGDPFRHVVIPDFFSPEFCQRLLDDFPSFEERFAMDEYGNVARKATREDVRDISDTYREVDDFIQTPEFLNLMSEITGIPDLLYDPEYFGGGTHENLHGQGLYTHVDFNYHPRGWHRRLNLIVYLNSGWKDEWGGSLELHSNPWDPPTDRAKSVLPLLNQAVLFETTEHSWHGFAQVDLPNDRRQLSRKSYAIYLYSKERPPEQTAASHTTVYVPYGMPDDVQPGIVLTEEQYQLLEARFINYRRLLELEYDRQQHVSERFNEEMEVWRGWSRLDLQGYAVQTKAPTGWFTDGWVSSEFSMEFRATRPVRGLLLQVWVPPKLGSDQVLEIRAGDWSGIEEVPAGEARTLKLPISVDADQTVEVAIRAGSSWSPGEGDTRALAYRMASAVLEH